MKTISDISSKSPVPSNSMASQLLTLNSQLSEYDDKGGPGRSASGSALVIVLGMLSVLMLMSIAFTTFMRTEHAGATNLKNGLVAKQALSTAIARVTDAIDLSIDVPVDGEPFPAVPVWPEPWLASSSSLTNDFLQSAALAPTERPGAQVLNYEMSRYLTPAQISLVRSAKVDWAPIYASVGNGTIQKDRGSGLSGQKVNLYGSLGRPANDSVVGRYAFLVLPTTGLLDLNLTGTNATSQSGSAENSAPRAVSDGSDARSFYLPRGSKAEFEYDGGSSTVAVKPMLEDPNRFLRARRDSLGGAFSSFLDARLELESAWSGSLWLGGHAEANKSGFNLKWPGDKTSSSQAERWNSGSPSENKLFPADMFAGFSTAVEGVDPEGRPRVHLPTPKEFDQLATSGDRIRAWGTRALAAMVKVFARSRISAGLGLSGAGAWERDAFEFFSKEEGAKYTLSKPRLATVAMLDALDDDLAPGSLDASGNASGSYWEMLPDLSDGPELRTSEGIANVKDRKPSSTDPLNFPATEAIPLLSHVYSYVTWDKVTTNTVRNGARQDENVPFDGSAGWQTWADTRSGANPDIKQAIKDMQNWRVVYEGTVHCGAVANVRNDVPDWTRPFNGKSYSMTLDWEVMTDYPRRGSVSRLPQAGGALDAYFNGDNGEMEWFTSVNSGSVPVSGSSEFIPASPGSWSARATKSGQKIGDGNPANRLLEVDSDSDSGTGPVKFYVICKPKSVPTIADAERELNQDGVPTGNYIGWKASANQNLEFYPPLNAEYQAGGENQDAFLPVRAKVTISEGSRVVQQVPAPAIDDAERKYWLRMDAGAWHNPANDSGSLFRGSKVSAILGSQAQNYIRKLREDPGEARLCLAWGWAMCTLPEFGFDTTSLVTDSEDDNGTQNEYSSRVQAWINNRLCMNDNNRFWDVKTGGDAYAGKILDRVDSTGNGGVYENLMGPEAQKKYNEASMSKGTVGNMLANRFFTDSFVGSAGGSRTFDLALRWMPGDTDQNYASRPDFLHRWKNPGGEKGKVAEGAMAVPASVSDAQDIIKTHVYNHTRDNSVDDAERAAAVFRNPGDMGSIMCGPFETLSVFRTYRQSRDGAGVPSYRADFHRVFDYFSGAEDARYPKDAPYADDATQTSLGYWKSNGLDAGTGEARDGAFGRTDGSSGSDMAAKLAYAAVISGGAVNLNAPNLVHLEDGPGGKNTSPRAASWIFGDDGRSYDGLKRRVPNLYPIMTALAGARYQAPLSGSTSTPRKLSEDQAAQLASAIQDAIETGATRFGSRRFGIPAAAEDAADDGWPQARSFSDALGHVDGETGEPNRLLEEIMDGGDLEQPKTDADREALVANVGGAFATRGQTFLALVRADAYTPKFGEEESTSDGNSLATTHALVELWRDPEPARTPYGTLPRSQSGQAPYLFHDWLIRSIRVF